MSWTRRHFLGGAMAVATLSGTACAQQRAKEEAGDVPALEPNTAPKLSRAIPNSGEQIPIVGVGTWQAFDVAPGGEDWSDGERALELFLRSGGRVIDSSPMYGRAEDSIGAMLAEQRGLPKPFLATKVWTTGRDAGRDQIEASFRQLRVPVIDLLQVHNLMDFDTHLGTLRELKESGRIRYIGATHYHSGGYEGLERVIRGGALDFVQLNYSLAEREAEARLLPLARDSRLGVIANRPFAGGELFSDIRRKPLPGFAGELGCTSWAQLLLKYVLSDTAVTCAVPGTRNPRHVLDNLGAAVGPMPDPALRRRILQAALG
jgi:aryl-alcohol dehydrogenase-like predicted oxidoreductase